MDAAVIRMAFAEENHSAESANFADRGPIYDALTTNRPYRGALPPEEALQILFQRSPKRLARCIRGAEVLRDLQRGRILPRKGKNDAGLLLRVEAACR